MRWRIFVLAALVSSGAALSLAGGPAFVAGSGYAPGVEGQPLLWASGSAQYFTDQGNLSPILTGVQADALVATAFNAWTSLPGVTLAATPGGHLAEDVNGGNIVAAGGVVTAPADITSSATGTPIGIIYDADGTVTDALLGDGAGNLVDCFTNAVYGGPDNFTAEGNIAHALVVINGNCAATSAQLPDVQYRLVRVLGRILGLGWSQANLNVLTRNPPPNSSDLAGFPVMHLKDHISCVPVSGCYPNAAVPKMDDVIALARVYPKSASQPAAGRIYGSVYFTDDSGTAVQPMQGVNVVARLLVTGQPSPQFVVTSVSGFLFNGNAGNIIDGYVDVSGLRYDRWGSGDPSLEGFFDLGQLTIPAGQTIAQYLLSVEALDPDWSLGVGPYAPTTVMPSGSFAPVVVTVTNGSNAERDILLLQDEIASKHPGSGSTYANPAALPQGGAWGSWISGYGSVDFFQFTAQANRTASIAVTALDESGQPTESKLLPVIGIWQLSDQSGNPAPASTPSAFNTITSGMTRLDAQFGVTDTFRVGVGDFRGDGRPDYFYQANLLYSDTVTPSRLSLAGGAATLNGTGFSQRLQVSAAGNSGSTLAASASQLQVTLPPGSLDGTATIQVSDPASGGSSQMIGALTYGALPTDLLLLLQGAEAATAVGSQAANPIRVRAVAADGVTPVDGATIAWSATGGVQLSVCGGTSFCSILSDEAGESFSWVTPIAIGQGTITIQLAPGAYSPPQTQLATVLAASTTLDLAALTPTRWVGQGATVAVPLTVLALDMGVPVSHVRLSFVVGRGNASLSVSSAITNSLGLATITAQLTNQSADVQISACVVPNNAPCQTFTLFSTAPSLWQLETVGGSSQIVTAGQPFQPLIMRVTDGSAAANPVMGVGVTFATTLSRANGSGLPILLGSSQTQAMTTQDGLASLVPSAGSVGPCGVFVSVSAGQLTAQFQLESVAAIVPTTPPSGTVKAPIAPRVEYFYEDRVPSHLGPPAVPGDLFAVPQIDSFSISESPAELRPSDSSELPSDPAMCDRETSPSSQPAEDDPRIPAPCATSKPMEDAVPKKLQPEESGGTPPVPNDVPSGETGVPARPQ